ncbi:MAG TPA: hypothetical protein VGQ83_13245 [Polyangia bacterium]|jgi:hypothetical protein
MRLGLAVALGCVALSGCTRPPPDIVSPLQSRVQQAGAAWNRYSQHDRGLIESGSFRVGLDELAVYLARGQPAYHWQTWTGKQWCRALLYGAEDSCVNLVVYSCQGTIVHFAPVSPALPCWRLSRVAGRIAEQGSYFDRRPLSRQWEILAGILRRGQTGQDVNLAFGQPYNAGVEAREDGTDAQSRVYLDHTGEAYGLRITLVSGKVVGWRVPAERQLTPEAQAKRLQATEQRLMAQLKQMEQQSAKQHKEEMRLLNQLQEQGAAILDRVAVSASAAMGGQAEPAPGGGGGGDPYAPVDRPARHVTGARTLTINGCTYRDGPAGHLGRSCSAKQPCPSDYTCHVLAGTSGSCVPTGQRCSR